MHFNSSTTLDPYDTDKMSLDLVQQFSGQAFTVGQQVRINHYTNIILEILLYFLPRSQFFEKSSLKNISKLIFSFSKVCLSDARQ